MRRGIVLAAGLGLIGIAILVGPRLRRPPGSPAGGAAAVPRVSVAEPDHDLGEVDRGPSQRHAFVVANRGTGPLEIRTEPHCGCTVLEHDREIAPGARGTIVAELKTRSLRGKFRKVIDLRTNDPDQPTVPLSLSGRAVEAVEILATPDAPLMLPAGRDAVLELAVRARQGARLTEARVDQPYARVEIGPEEQGTYRLRLTVGPEAPLGTSWLELTLTTTADQTPTLSQLIGCQKGISVQPPELRFAGRAPGGPAGADSQSVLLSHAGGAFQVRSATSSDPRVTVRTEALPEGSRHRVIATLEPGDDAPSGPGTVTIETDDPLQPSLRIPLLPPRPAGAEAPARIPGP